MSFKRLSTIKSLMVKILLFSLLIYFSLDYGVFFTRAKNTQLIGFFGALVLPVLFFYPRIMLYINLGIIFFLPSALYGVQVSSALMSVTGSIYGRGLDKVIIPYVNIFLWITAIALVLQLLLKKQENENIIACNLYKYFWAFNFSYIVYILWGFTLGIEVRNILSTKGVINLTNMSVIVYIMLNLLRTKKDYDRLKIIFLGSTLVRAGFSVFRYFFLGGDPRNPYAVYGGISTVKITMFDISDGLIQCVAMFYALWMLFNRGNKFLPRRELLIYWLITAFGLFNILFSYRRTAWGGLLLALAWLMLNFQWEKKIAVGFFSAVLVLFIIFGVASDRFVSDEGMFSDFRIEEGGVSLSQGRFTEIVMAWQTIKENIYFGIGPWGKYKVITGERWDLSPEIVHSSIVFMLLKMGVLGLSLCLLILAGYIVFWLKHRKELPLHVRGFAEAWFAGFLFFLPNVIWGTPIIEYRSMLLMGFAMAIPYITFHFYKTNKLSERPSAVSN